MAQKKYHHGDLKNALTAAGMRILAKDGIAGLSLRKVAQKAGVSHAAPYAHFADKQALIAAISTEGFRLLLEEISAARQDHPDDPARQLVAAAWAAVSFARTSPAHYRVTFSNAVEREHDYPALVEMTRRSFEQVVGIVAACQSAGVLRAGPADAMAVSVWSAVHGFASLLIEGQISHTLLEKQSVLELLLFVLSQLTLEPLEAKDFDDILHAA